jgi:hypothetical protein
MGTMRMLLERLTGRYRFIFKPEKLGNASFGPDVKLVAKPTKTVSVELEHYAQTDRWHATILDDVDAEDSPDGIVGGHAFAKGLTQDEAEEAAIEVTLKYLGQKGRAVREATGRGMRAMTEGVVTFQAQRTGKGFRSEPRPGVHVEVLPGRTAEEWELSIYDDESPYNATGDAAQVVPLYGRTIDEMLTKARVYVTQYLKRHPEGWAEADREEKFQRMGRGR